MMKVTLFCSILDVLLYGFINLLLLTLPGIRVGELAGVILVAGLVHDPHEHLEADDGVDDDHK
jgi:hypothetical protein